MMNTALNDCLREAGRMMLEWQRPRVFAKGAHADFVTEADLAVQSFLLEKLAKIYPEAKFFAEEKKDNVLTDDLTFIIDPIDGTTNYFRGRGTSAISVGAVENRRAVFGAIFDPYRDKMYYAEAGKGAWCNGERLHTADTTFDQALIGLGTSPYHTDLMALTARSVAELLPRCADLRRCGSAALEMCEVACGTLDGMFEWVLQPWDYCAGALLVEEAGGRAGNIMGAPVTYEKGIPLIAAGSRCYDDLQELLQKIAREG